MASPRNLAEAARSDAELGENLSSLISPFRHCDRLSYSYLIMGLLFCLFGVYFTLVPLSGFANMSHNLWFIGPTFIFFGFVMTMKMVMYLRNKVLLMGILRQREIIQIVCREHEASSLPPHPQDRPTFNPPQPPPYSTLPLATDVHPTSEAPPPTYEQAILQEKLKSQKV